MREHSESANRNTTQTALSKQSSKFQQVLAAPKCAAYAVRDQGLYLIWGRSVVRLVFAAFFFYLRPQGAQWDPVGH
jgi:hypothetical protein